MSAQTMTSTRRLAPLAAVLALFLASCGGSDCSGPLCVQTGNVSVSVSPTSGTIEVGETLQLSASVTGATNTAVSWSVSTGASAASVSSSGLVTGIAAGTAVIVATSQEDGSKSASASITVTQPVAVAVAPALDTIEIGQTTTLTATVTGSTNSAVTWSVTSGATVADVSTGGVVTGLTAGTATVQASAVADPSKTASATIVVTEHPCDGGDITLDQTVDGTLSISDCQFSGFYEDEWYFSLTSQTDVVIDLASVDFDAWVVLSEVVDGDFNFIDEDDDSGGGTNSQLAMTLDPGDYAISVTSFNTDETGAYSLTLTEGAPQTVDVVIQNELLSPVLVYINGNAAGVVAAQDTAGESFNVVDLQVSWDVVPDTTSTGDEIGDLDIGGDFSTILGADLSATETFTVDAVIGVDAIFKPTIVNNTGVTLLMGVNLGLATENLCNCTVPIGSAGTWIGYYWLYTNSNVYAYLSGSGYTGTPTYFDSFSGSVDTLTGHLSFTFTIAPSLVAPPNAPAAVSPQATGQAEVGTGPRAVIVRDGRIDTWPAYNGPVALRSAVHQDHERDPSRVLLRAPGVSKPASGSETRRHR